MRFETLILCLPMGLMPVTLPDLKEVTRTGGSLSTWTNLTASGCAPELGFSRSRFSYSVYCSTVAAPFANLSNAPGARQTEPSDLADKQGATLQPRSATGPMQN